MLQETGTIEEPLKLKTRNPKSKISQHFGVLAIFALLAIIATWPVLLNMAGSIYGEHWVDQDQHFWSLWQTKHALLNFQNPYHTEYLYYPYGTDLYLHALDLFDGVISIPFQALFGVVAAYNVIILLAITLTGYTGWLLCSYVTGNALAGFVGGFAIAFMPGHFRHANGLTEFVGLQTVLMVILLALKWRDNPRRAYIGWLAFFLALTIYKSYYLTLYTLLFLGLFGLYELGRNGRKKLGLSLRLIGGLAAGIILGVIAGLPLIIGTIRNTVSPIWQAQIEDYNEFNFLHGMDVGFIFRPLRGTLLSGFAGGAYNAYYLGIFVMLLAALGWWLGKRVALFWGICSAIFTVLSLGPYLRSGEQKLFPLPYWLFEKLPFASFSRDPSRFMLIAAPCLGVLIAFAVSAISYQLSAKGGEGQAKSEVRKKGFLPFQAVVNRQSLIVNSLIVFVLVADIFSFRPDNSPITFAPILSQLKANPGYAVMDLPFTPHYRADEVYMANATVHGRPIMGGYLSRVREDPYSSPDSPFYNFRLWGPEQDIIAPGISGNEINMLSYFKIGYIIIHKTFPGFKDVAQAQKYVGNAIGKPIFEDSELAVYQVPAVSPDSVKGFGQIGGGWEWVEKDDTGLKRWMVDNGRIIYYATADSTQSMSFAAASFAIERDVELYVNGQKVQSFKVGELNQYKFDLKLQKGRNEILIKNLQPSASPLELGVGKDKRKLSLVFKDIRFS